MPTAMKRYLFLLAAVALLAACTKDNDIQPTQGQGVGPKRLASMTYISYSQSCYNYNPETGGYELSSTNGSKGGTTLRWSSAGLLLAINVDFIQSGISIEYEGDKMKRVVINASAMGAQSDITYTCSYTGDNLTQLYASMPGQSWTMTTFTYSPDGELLSTREESSNGDLIVKNLLWDNGNVIHMEKTSSNSHTSTTYRYTYDYLYDNMTSAFTGMEMYALLSEHYLLSRNNVLRIIESRSSTYDSPEPESSLIDTTIYTYTYDGDWPISYSSTLSNSSPYGGGHRSESTSYLRYTDGSGATAPQTFTISATSNMPDSAAVHVYGGGDYEAGRQVVLQANCYQPNIRFLCWSDGNTDNPRTFTVTGDAQFIAVFGNNNNR